MLAHRESDTAPVATAPQPATVTPEQAIAWGYTPIPLRATGNTKIPARVGWLHATYTPCQWRDGEGVGLRCGRQADGSYLNVADHDSHKPYQDAAVAFNAALITLPVGIRQKCFTAISTGGGGRYIIFRAARALPTCKLHDAQGRHTGELRGDGAHVVCPTRDRWLGGDLACLPLLTDAELDLVLAAIGHNNPAATSLTAPISPQDRARFDQALARWGTNMDVLLRAADLPRRWKNPAVPGWRVLRGDLVPISDTSGLPDSSDSRFVVASSLVRHGYPDDECYAILWEIGDFGARANPHKGPAWLRDDIIRIVRKARARYPDARPTPTRCRTQSPAAVVVVPDVPCPPRAPGRPPSLTLNAYHTWLHENRDAANLIFGTIREIAARLGCSPRTIERLEAKGRAAGLMQREVSRDRQTSWITLRDDPAPIPAADPPPPESSAQISTGQVPHKIQIEERARTWGEHNSAGVSQVAPPAPSPVAVPVVRPAPRPVPDADRMPVSTGGGGRSWRASDAGQDGGGATVRPTRPASAADVVARAVALHGPDQGAALRWARAAHGLFMRPADRGKFFGLYASELALRELAASGDADAAAAVEVQEARCARTVALPITRPPRRVAVLGLPLDTG